MQLPSGYQKQWENTSSIPLHADITLEQQPKMKEAMESSSHFESNAHRLPQELVEEEFAEEREKWLALAKTSAGLFKIHALMSLIFLFPLLALDIIPSSIAPIIMLIPFCLSLIGLKLGHSIHWQKMIVLHSAFATIYAIAPLTGLMSSFLDGGMLLSMMFVICPLFIPLFYIFLSKAKFEKDPPSESKALKIRAAEQTYYYYKEPK